MKKILIALTTFALAGAGLVAVASPAAAHHNTVSGIVVCDTETGEWNIAWSVENSEKNKSETVTSNPEGVATGTIAAGATAVFNQTTTGTGPFSLTVYGVWSNGVKNTNSGTATAPEGGCEKYVPPTPTPTPDPTPEPSPEPPKDFCPDLPGVQWENYDCLTPTATPEPPVVEVPVVETPVVVAPVEEAVVTPEKPAKPATVTVPAAATIPNAVPAGDGSSQEGINWLVIAILTAATVVGALALRKWNN